MKADDITPEQHAWNLYAHNAWLQERQARGVPPEGHTPDRINIHTLTRHLENH